MLDNLQRKVLAVVAGNRTPESAVAGGAVLQRHGPRLSADIDIFHPTETLVERYAAVDLGALRAAGFAADVIAHYPGFVEATVGNEAEGRTRLQWVADTARRYLRAAEDPEFGFRLQMPDLAVGKLIAAATRGEPRDLVDLVFIDRNYMPIWYLAVAAPGKDPAFGPLSFLARVERNSLGKTDAIDRLESLEELDGARVRRYLVDVIAAARETVAGLPPRMVGCLYRERSGEVVLRPDPAVAKLDAYDTLEATESGAWPILPEVVSDEIRRILPAK